MSTIALVELASTPTTPTTGKVRVYVGSDGILRSVDDTGAVTIYSPTGTEAIQDAIGAMIVDTSSIDVTYNDAGNAMTFDVIPGGVNHNALLNYVANQHVDHSTVSISAGTGLTGGGDLTASRTISMPATGTAGTYKSVTTDAQGRVTAGTNPTTLAGYGITDAQPLDGDLTAVAALAGTGLISRTAANTMTTRTLTASTGMTVTNGDGVSGNPTVAITNSGVTAATYGSATQVPQIAINAQGQATAASNVSIAIPSTAITDFTEAVQDVMGGALTDSSSVDFQYNDVANTQTAVVLPAGVDHNSLQNFVANKHIDHSAVSVNAGTGLSGGGDLTATRTISMPNTGTAGTYGSGTAIPVITTDAQGRVTSVTTAANTQSQWTDAGGFLTWSDETGKDLHIRQASAAGESPFIGQVKSNGTLASPTAVLSGDKIGGNGYYGWNSGGQDANPSIEFSGFASENHTPSAQGGELRISTIANGATAQTLRATLQNDGNWNLQSNRITNAADPVNPQDYATKAYVDADSWTELFTSSSATSTSNTTLTAVAALAFTAVAGHTYYLEYTVRFQTAATTTGITLTINTGTTAVGTIAAQVNMPVAADGTAALYTGSISSLNDLVTSPSVEAANTNYIATIKGSFVCTTGGTIQPYFRSEVNGSQVTFGAGSFALIRDFT